ncbi:MAG TPA: putative Ig domain-containing protein, partial [Leptospiraceae bacterium]|nr:putative Ig domain-containing protein [Leptospiraceae bacterium]
MKKNAFYLLITLLLLSFVGISNCSDRKKTGVLSGIVPLALLGTGKTSLPPINKTYPTEETIVLNIGQQLNLSPSQHVEGSEYTISPQLPDGLNLDPKTGVISGTSTASFPATVFTITQTKSDGTKTSWKVTIGVNGNGSNISTAESATPTFNLT